jgi:hypothetical protein
MLLLDRSALGAEQTKGDDLMAVERVMEASKS